MCIKRRAGKVSFFWLSDQSRMSINLSVSSSGLFIVFPIECWIGRHCAGLLSSQGETLSELCLRIGYLTSTEQKALSCRLQKKKNVLCHKIEAFIEGQKNGSSVQYFSWRRNVKNLNVSSSLCLVKECRECYLKPIGNSIVQQYIYIPWAVNL